MQALARIIMIWILCTILSLVFSEGRTPLSVHPKQVVTVPSRSVTFSCSLESTSSSSRIVSEVNWIINGSRFESLGLANVTSEFSSIGRGIGTLTFRHPPLAYHMTGIQCRAGVTSGATQVSDNAELIVLTDLPSVDYLMLSEQSSTVSLNWTSSSSVDQSYCVYVIASTLPTTKVTTCDLRKTNFEFDLPPKSWCDRYFYTVTPTSDVYNGTGRTVSYAMNVDRPSKIIQCRVSSDCDSDVMSSVKNETLEVSLTMSAPVCTGEVRLVDLESGEAVTVGDSDLIKEEANITFAAVLNQKCTCDHRYGITVEASNINGSATAYCEYELHDCPTELPHLKTTQAPPQRGTMIAVLTVSGVVVVMVLGVIAICILVKTLKKRRRASIEFTRVISKENLEQEKSHLDIELEDKVGEDVGEVIFLEDKIASYTL